MTATPYQDVVERAGITYFPPRRAPDRNFNQLDQALPGINQVPRWEQVVRTFYLAPLQDAAQQGYDLVESAVGWQASLLINDGITLGIPLAASLLQLPWASISPFPYALLPDPAIPPPHFGLPYHPAATSLYRLVYRALALRLAAGEQRWRALATAWKLPPQRDHLLDAALSPQLIAYPGTFSLEYPRAQQLPHVIPVGPLTLPVHATPSKVSFSGHIVVTEGTTHRDTKLLRLVVNALWNSQYPVVLIAADTTFSTTHLPPHIRAVDYIPYTTALEQAILFVTNGGAGSITAALQASVPLVISPAALDKFETARRVHWAGLGRAVADVSHCTIEALRAGVLSVVTEPRYRQRVQAIRTESAKLGGAQRLAFLLEQLASHAGP